MLDLRTPLQPAAQPTVNELVEVLILQSQRLVGDALELLLNDQPDMIVVGKIDCRNGAGARAARLSPDVIIIDFRMNLAAAGAAAAEIRHSRSSASMVALIRDQAVHSLFTALEAGVSGIITESDSSSNIVSCIRQAAQGKTLIPPDMVASLIRQRRLRDDPNRRLTKREAEILDLLARGLRSRQIANDLGISYLTVRTHIRNLAVKLAAHSKLEVVAKAYELDLVAERVPDDGHRDGSIQ
jgi:DNA-binding NarL/FixJ family response regulator